jgi:hypothetical protein
MAGRSIRLPLVVGCANHFIFIIAEDSCEVASGCFKNGSHLYRALMVMAFIAATSKELPQDENDSPDWCAPRGTSLMITCL